MRVSEDDRAVTEQVVDVTIAVDIVDIRALAAGEESGILAVNHPVAGDHVSEGGHGSVGCRSGQGCGSSQRKLSEGKGNIRFVAAGRARTHQRREALNHFAVISAARLSLVPLRSCLTRLQDSLGCYGLCSRFPQRSFRR